MMRSPLTDDEFEDFLQQQVNDHRMYPSDKLWRNIQTSVHGETRWPALTYISIFIIASLVVSTLLVKPEERMNKTAAAYAISTNSSLPGSTVSTSATYNQSNAVESSPLQKSYTESITLQTITAVNKKIEQEHNNVAAILLASREEEIVKSEPPAVVAVAQVAKKNTIVQDIEKVSSNVSVTNDQEVASGKPASKYFNTFGLMDLPAFRVAPAAYHSTAYSNEDNMWRNYPLLNAKEIIRKKLSKFNFQFYITPSVSYRRLTDAKGNTAKPYTAIPASANYQLDLSQVVRHSPSIGAEVGFALGYKLGSNFTVKGGLQFNVRQYNIEAYTMQPLQQAAQPLTSENISTPIQATDTVSGSYITSFNYAQITSKPIVLKNRYYEIAAPIGIDWKLYIGSNGNLTVNVAATLQPTYTFDKEPFAVTTDYKNYTDGASIMRNWNLNSSVEAYISYQLGPLRWQVGPQFRYQHLPTYSNYSIREHLLDYGLKIGFTKSLD